MLSRMRRTITLSRSSSRSSGFTLIEAVVLASLIGIVAAFAVPRFTGLRNGVRASEVTALGANFAMQRRPRTLNFWPRVPLS
jgi:type II secretory pathway pseudopilin PulG